MKFHLLGPVEILADDGSVPSFRPQLQGLIAYLLLHANQHVSIDRLTSAVWGEAAPSTARAQIHTMVATVRRRLAACGDAQRIITGPEGYKIVVADDEFDFAIFESLVIEAKDAAVEGDGLRAEVLLIRALGLWRGPAFAGTRVAFAETGRAQLDEKRLLAQEQLADLWLTLGKHSELASELPGLLTLYPAREPIARQLMLALYRSGQQAAALGVFRDLRAILVEEHGIEPARETQDLQGSILRGDPAIAFVDVPKPEPQPAPVRPVRPAPPVRPGLLVGRTRELDQLDDALEQARSVGRNTPVLLFGPPGIGKTAMSQEWQRLRSADFPAGPIYLDLRPGDRDGPDEVLHGAFRTALRALQVAAADIPDDPAERASLYRSVLGQAAALVVIDHAESSVQVRELLAPTDASAFLVVSHRRLDGLLVSEGARLVELEVLDRDDSVELIERALGRVLAGPERAAAGRLAELCDDWPLALRIAVARVLVSGGPLADAVGELEEPHRRLAYLHLAEHGTSLPARLDDQIALLPSAAARLYRALGGLGGSGFGLAQVETIAKSDDSITTTALDELVANSLVMRTGHRTYRMFGLVQLHAAALPPIDVPRWPFETVVTPSAHGRTAPQRLRRENA